MLEGKADICLKYIVSSDTAASEAQINKTALDPEGPKKEAEFSRALEIPQLLI